MRRFNSFLGILGVTVQKIESRESGKTILFFAPTNPDVQSGIKLLCPLPKSPRGALLCHPTGHVPTGIQDDLDQGSGQRLAEVRAWYVFREVSGREGDKLFPSFRHLLRGEPCTFRNRDNVGTIICGESPKINHKIPGDSS